MRRLLTCHVKSHPSFGLSNGGYSSANFSDDFYVAGAVADLSPARQRFSCTWSQPYTTAQIIDQTECFSGRRVRTHQRI